MEDTQVNQEVAVERVEQSQEVVQPVEEPVFDQPAPQIDEVPEVQAAKVCDSCNTIAELFDVPHHQVGNPKVWRYCKRCKMAHDVEVATNEKLKEIMAVNPAAVNDPAFVGQVRDQLTKELMQA